MHENGHVSTKDEFFADYLSRGYQEAVSVPKEIMRQFGNTVIVLFNAHYRHLNEPDRSSSQAMHAWVKPERTGQSPPHSSRFEPY